MKPEDSVAIKTEFVVFTELRGEEGPYFNVYDSYMDAAKKASNMNEAEAIYGFTDTRRYYRVLRRTTVVSMTYEEIQP